MPSATLLVVVVMMVVMAHPNPHAMMMVVMAHPNPHAMMMMMVMMAQLDGDLSRLHIPRLGFTPRIVGFECRHRVRHRIQEFPIGRRRILRAPLRLHRRIGAAYGGQGGRSSQQTSNLFVHCSSPKGRRRTCCAPNRQSLQRILVPALPGI